jgi:hypothetical protein
MTIACTTVEGLDDEQLIVQAGIHSSGLFARSSW